MIITDYNNTVSTTQHQPKRTRGTKSAAGNPAENQPLEHRGDPNQFQAIQTLFPFEEAAIYPFGTPSEKPESHQTSATADEGNRAVLPDSGKKPTWQASASASPISAEDKGICEANGGKAPQSHLSLRLLNTFASFRGKMGLSRLLSREFRHDSAIGSAAENGPPYLHGHHESKSSAVQNQSSNPEISTGTSND
jgi:hypothetical protein